ncbi:MAG TPA: prepilin-type N-terminal cleavage/methylation domain-containing protein [Vicinamibacterales bacterium]
MALERSRWSSESGFSLVEVLASTAILSVALISLAQLFAISTSSNRSARTNTYAALLAEQKMEQLRGLTWGYDTLGLPISDFTTDTSVAPPVEGCPPPAGGGVGTGLSPSPYGTLASNVAGWVDYIDGNGCLLGGGAVPPPGTVYTRRWSVEPVPTNPNNTLVLQVLVTTRTNRGDADAGRVLRMNDEARLVSVKTRKTK